MECIDIKRAYVHAPARRPVYIEIPIEDWEPGDEGKVARLDLSLYETRDAAQNWTRAYTEFLRKFIQFIQNCNIFFGIR